MYVFAIYSLYEPTKNDKLCYENFTKFENGLKIGPEPIFYIFYGMKMDEKHMLDTILIEFRAKNKGL